MNELIYFEEQTILELDEALNEKDRLIEENYLTSKIREDIKEEVKKLKVTTKDRIERLKKELD